MAVLLQIPENPNCQAMDGQVFQCRTAARTVAGVRMQRGGDNDWCAITGIDATGGSCPATACLIEDSGEGACYLVMGGEWGLRLRRAAEAAPWSLDDPGQWGEPILLLGGDGADVRFADSPESRSQF